MEIEDLTEPVSKIESRAAERKDEKKLSNPRCL